MSKKTLLIQDPARIVDTTKRDEYERRAVPCQTAIENKPTDSPRVPTGRPKKLK